MATDHVSKTKPKGTPSPTSASATPTDVDMPADFGQPEPTAAVVVMPDTIPDGSPISLAIRQRCIVLAAFAKDLNVTNAAQYEIALQHQSDIRSQIDTIEEGYQPAIDKLRVPLDGFYEDKRALLKPLQIADKIISGIALAWKAAEDERAERETRRLQAEADAEAQREREAQEKAIERERAAALKSGDKTKAAELKEELTTLAEQPVVGRQVQVTSHVPAVAGMGAGKKWVPREDTIDIVKLAEAVAKGWCSKLAIVPNMKFLNAQAKSREKEFNEVDPKTKRTPFPGVQAYNAGITRRT